MTTAEIDLGRLIDALPGLVWTASPDGRAEYMGKGWLEYTGLTFEAAVGAGWTTAVHPEDAPRLLAAWADIIASGKLGEVEARLRRADGVYRWFLFRACPMPEANGEVARWCGMNVDIDDRVRAEDAVRAHQLRFERILDGLPAIAALFSPTGKIIFCNRWMLEYLDVTLEEIQAEPSAYNYHPDERDEVLSEWVASVHTGKPFDKEARLQRADGAYVWHRTMVFPLRDASGEIELWYGLAIDIDDAKRAEAASRDHRRRFRQIVDDMPAIVALFAADGPISFSNKRMLDYHGQTLEQLQAGEPGYTFHPEDRPEILQRYGKAMATGEPFDCEVRLLRGDGGYRWHLVQGFPLRDAQGGVDIWCGLFTDIDDARQAQAQLAAEKAELQRAHDFLTQAQRLSKTGSFTWDGHPEKQIWSDEMYRILGLEPGTRVTVEMARAMVHPDDLPLYDAMVERGAVNEEMDGTYRIVTPAGVVRHTHTIAHRLKEVTDRPVYLGATQDVTDSKIAEEALKESEAELRRAHGHLTEGQRLSKTGSFTVDVIPDEHIWSEEFYRIFEVDPATTPSMQIIRDLIHPDDLAGYDAAVARAVADLAPFEWSYRICPPSGLKYVHAVSHPIDHPAGRPVFMGALQDVTETRLAEDALNKARAELAHVSRVTALSALTASIAHEVNQPLAGIITNASTCLRMLAADPPNVEGARATAQRTIRDGNRASEVIQRLRALFSRKAPVHEPVDLNEAASEVIALSTSELLAHKVVARIEFAQNLPTIRGDRVQLQQVVLNLVLNAADAMKAIDERPREMLIRTTADASGQVTLSVRDAGVGVDPQHLERLFDAFYTTKAEGMGVGLAISRSIIESHEGRLWAEANAGPGATFAFSIPADVERAEDPQPTDAEGELVR